VRTSDIDGIQRLGKFLLSTADQMINFDVFISYSQHDKATADAACAALEADGIRCWIAPRDVAPGTEWAASIIDAIEHSRVLVLIFSSNANHSKQVHREVQRAFEKEVPVVPFRIEQIVAESSLAYYMGSVHWLDALTPPLEQHLKRLVASTKAFLEAKTFRSEQISPQDGLAKEAERERNANSKQAAGVESRKNVIEFSRYKDGLRHALWPSSKSGRNARIAFLVFLGLAAVYAGLVAQTANEAGEIPVPKTFDMRNTDRDQTERIASLYRLIIQAVDTTIAPSGEWKGQPVAYSSKKTPKVLMACLEWRDTALTWRRWYFRTGSSSNPPASADAASAQLKARCVMGGCAEESCVIVDRDGENVLKPPPDRPRSQ